MRKSVVLLPLLGLAVGLLVFENEQEDASPNGSAPAETEGNTQEQKKPQKIAHSTPKKRLAPWKRCEKGQVLASWYGPGFDGNLTASGTVYNMYDVSVAHPTFKFGTSLVLRNPKNGAEVKAIVNDRGPYYYDPAYGMYRQLDVSRGGAEKLGFVEQGVVCLDILETSSSG